MAAMRQAGAVAGAPEDSDEGPDEDESPSFRPHLAQRGTTFRRRHRLHGPIALYGGRIDAGKGCEELIEYFSSYVQEGGDATLALMGVKLMPLPEEPFIRFAGRLSDSGAAPGARSGHGRRRALALREPVAAGARIVRRRHADSGQRAQRSARRSLPQEQRRPVLRRPRRVHGVPEAADRRSAPAREHGAERPGVRAAELPVGRDPGEVRKDVHAAAAGARSGRSSSSSARSGSRSRSVGRR